MGRYRKYFKIYRKMQEMNIKSLMYYRADFLMMTFFTVLSQVSNLAVIGIIYTNIPTVGGWSVWEILLLYGYLLFSEGWVNFFFQGSWKIAQMVNKSEIDRFLVRPLPAGMQIVAERDAGKGVLLVSLELDEVMNVSDRILVMYEGEIVGEFDPKKVSVEELGLYMAGSKRKGIKENG